MLWRADSPRTLRFRSWRCTRQGTASHGLVRGAVRPAEPFTEHTICSLTNLDTDAVAEGETHEAGADGVRTALEGVAGAVTHAPKAERGCGQDANSARRRPWSKSRCTLADVAIQTHGRLVCMAINEKIKQD